ncbi:MAG TPA: trigger factor [Candidatus Prevotella avicola]|jgi:trigger factor|uniref:Trigger factor n=1 Tax=Candidatus Prevotella avicola TaxID=2838738 RepID=A0A9D2JWH4_9BACT|nr:trigger factor [Candidatus Prevotella avicola]
MNISFDIQDKVNGLLTITVEEEDYKADVEKTLKDYRKRASVPGFRPGQAPIGMIKRQYGTAVKMDAINNLVGRKIYDYLTENNIQFLGEPMTANGQEPIDVEKPAPYTMKFDIAVAPEVNVTLSDKDTLDYYDIQVDDKIIDGQVDMYASRMGEHKTVEEYQDNDILRGDLRELDADGNVKEGGITTEGAVMMPMYIKVEDQKKLFDGVKMGDLITFNPRKAYPENDGEIASLLKIDREAAKDINADFSFHVTEISRFFPHAVDQQLFDQVFGEGNVKDEAGFRAKIAENVKEQLATQSDFRFLLDMRKHYEDEVGTLTYPDELLKRMMKAKNKDKGDDFVEKNYNDSVKELTWHLIKEKLVKDNDIKINDEDLKETAREAARAQFAQYGMSNVPAEYIDNYAQEMLKKGEQKDAIIERSIDRKLVEVAKNVAKINKKEISLDDFNKLA